MISLRNGREEGLRPRIEARHEGDAGDGHCNRDAGRGHDHRGTRGRGPSTPPWHHDRRPNLQTKELRKFTTQDLKDSNIVVYGSAKRVDVTKAQERRQAFRHHRGRSCAPPEIITGAGAQDLCVTAHVGADGRLPRRLPHAAAPDADEASRATGSQARAAQPAGWSPWGLRWASERPARFQATRG